MVKGRGRQKIDRQAVAKANNYVCASGYRCGVHLANISRRCEMVTYCHMVIRPGYCPFCLGDQNWESSKRMRYWKQSNKLWAHIEEHLKILQEYSCTHPMCQEQFQDEMGLCHHLADIHGLQKAIWDRREQPVTLSGQSPETKLDEHFKRSSWKRMSNQTESEHLEPRQECAAQAHAAPVSCKIYALFNESLQNQ